LIEPFIFLLLVLYVFSYFFIIFTVNRHKRTQLMKFVNYNGAWRYVKRIQGLSPLNKLRCLLRIVMGETIISYVFGGFALRLVEISLTDRCQCSCGHCFAARKAPEDELSCAEVETLLNELSHMGVTEILFSGGEPLLHPDILPLIDFAVKKGFLVRLITNGILLDENMVVALKQAGLGWCSLSLDGPTPEIHDAFRGYPGCFEKVVNGLNLLVKHDIPCSIVTVARRDLIKSKGLENIVKLGADLGVQVVRIQFPVPLGRYKHQRNEVLTLDERQEVRKLIRYGNVTMESPHETSTCKAAITKVYILPNGDIMPCAFVPLSYGNIRKDRFMNVWKAIRSFTRLYKTRGKCPVCDPVKCHSIFEAAEAQKVSAEISRGGSSPDLRKIGNVDE
jgi:MoaA/NifB/PqqE/SkfB family radical SAM enzyme